ncbi:stage V sporulation protein AA, partial [Bacillus pumilus]|uniref:stage V sporulation protein AA n=1 Tax=Bacillus pumilus TaxID=1408 RepID=UPI001C92C359
MEGEMFVGVGDGIKRGNDEVIYLEDMGEMSGDEFGVEKLRKMAIYDVSKKDGQIGVVDIMDVVKTMKKRWGGMEIERVGGSEGIVEIDRGKGQVCRVLFVLV